MTARSHKINHGGGEKDVTGGSFRRRGALATTLAKLVPPPPRQASIVMRSKRRWPSPSGGGSITNGLFQKMKLSKKELVVTPSSTALRTSSSSPSPSALDLVPDIRPALTFETEESTPSPRSRETFFFSPSSYNELVERSEENRISTMSLASTHDRGQGRTNARTSSSSLTSSSMPQLDQEDSSSPPPALTHLKPIYYIQHQTLKKRLIPLPETVQPSECLFAFALPLDDDDGNGDASDDEEDSTTTVTTSTGGRRILPDMSDWGAIVERLSVYAKGNGKYIDDDEENDRFRHEVLSCDSICHLTTILEDEEEEEWEGSVIINQVESSSSSGSSPQSTLPSRSEVEELLQRLSSCLREMEVNDDYDDSCFENLESSLELTIKMNDQSLRSEQNYQGRCKVLLSSGKTLVLNTSIGTVGPEKDSEGETDENYAVSFVPSQEFMKTTPVYDLPESSPPTTQDLEEETQQSGPITEMVTIVDYIPVQNQSPNKRFLLFRISCEEVVLKMIIAVLVIFHLSRSFFSDQVFVNMQAAMWRWMDSICQVESFGGVPIRPDFLAMIVCLFKEGTYHLRLPIGFQNDPMGAWLALAQQWNSTGNY